MRVLVTHLCLLLILYVLIYILFNGVVRQMTYAVSSISEYRSSPQFLIIAMIKSEPNRLEINAVSITIIKRVDS